MSRFLRNSFTHTAGLDPARIYMGRIVGINLVTYTVDVRSQFDRLYHFNIRVASPYLHYNRGEGLSVSPEIGAVCMVTVPGDTSGPYVSAFLMPSSTTDTSALDAPFGTDTHGAPSQYPTTASFAGGRPIAKAGDIALRNRDGSFIVLHRGGVLQIGLPLAQRLFLPLGDHIIDISQQYSQHNAGGSILWGIQEGPSQDLPTQCVHCYRVFADDKYADIRVVTGKVHSPIPEPGGDSGETVNLGQLGIGTDKDNPIICEVVVAPQGFNAESGEAATPDTRKTAVFRFFFDRKGGTFLRCMGNMLLSFKQKLMIHTTDTMTLTCEKDLVINAKKGITIGGGPITNVKGDVVRIGGGASPVARVGDMTRTMLPVAQISGMMGATPFTGTLTIATPLYGTVISGNSKVLA